jgi:predicted small secreted protein
MNLAQLKQEEIEARMNAKVAKAIWQELVREAEFLKRLVAKAESKILVCLVLLIFVGGCGNTFRGFGTLVKGVGQDIEQAATGNEIAE